MGTTHYFHYVTLPDSESKRVSLSQTILRLFEVFDLSCLSDPAVPDVRYCSHWGLEGKQTKSEA